MTEDIYCPGGFQSQTGTAVSLRYPGNSIRSCGDSIEDIPMQMLDDTGPYVAPIWNSHQGEIRFSRFIWDYIENSKLQISDIWAKQIEFWWMRKISTEISDCSIIGSVAVAKTQCSKFLLNNRFTLKEYKLTTVAMEKYIEGELLQGVLVAPNQYENNSELEVVNKKTANPCNFTTFVKFYSSYTTQLIDSKVFLTGVALKPLNVSLGEAEESFFANLFSEVYHIDDIPKLIFVIKRDSKVGLIFEGPEISAGDLLDAEQIEAGDITVYEKAGAMAKSYSGELYELFNQEFTSLINSDFILHKGENSCLFSCPALGLYTHGYEETLVEPVIRFYINKCFELIDNNVKCSQKQKELFDRYKNSWEDKKSEFIQFQRIN